MSPSSHLTQAYLEALATSGLITSEDPGPLVEHLATVCPTCAGVLASWQRQPVRPATGRRRSFPVPQPARARDVLAAIAALRQDLQRPGMEVILRAQTAVELAEGLATGPDCSATLKAELLAEAVLLEAQARLCSGQVDEAEALVTRVETDLLPDGWLDPLVGAEVEATAGLLAYSRGRPKASTGRWRRVQRLALQLEDPHLLGQAAATEAWVRQASADPEGARTAREVSLRAHRPHWIAVLELIEQARRAAAEKTQVN